MSAPRCSVVVSSRDRRRSLALLLEALALQTLPAGTFEVIVVLDGACDDSADLLEHWAERGMLQLRPRTQAHAGRAAARNAGAALARAPVIVFLDDDVVPAPDALERHVAWHAAGEPIAVLGDYALADRHRSFARLASWAAWEERFHVRAAPGHLPSYRDFAGGHVSVRRTDFQRAAGFDPAFRGYGGEDYDLGHRLMKIGVRLVADRRIRAAHHHAVSGTRLVRAARDEAHGDVLLATRHPELRRDLRVMAPADGAARLFRAVAFGLPLLGDPVAALLRLLLPVCELLRLRRAWLGLFAALRTYAYSRGLCDRLGRIGRLRELRRTAPPLPVVTLDVTHGVPRQLPPLPTTGPFAVRVRIEGRDLGAIAIRRLDDEPRRRLAREIVAQLALPLLFDATVRAHAGTAGWGRAAAATAERRGVLVAAG